MKYSNEELLKMHRDLVLGRKTEETLQKWNKKGVLPGFYHLALGQEAIGIGAVHALRENDYYTPTHRDHPAMVALLDTKKFIAEVNARTTGINNGKSFTFHIISLEDRMLGVNGMLGAAVPMSVGYAWKKKVDKEDSVVVCSFGDGTSSEGDVHEGMIMASMMKAPVVFLIQNNEYGVTTKCSDVVQLKDNSLAVRAEGYGMPYTVVNGHDVLEVREAIEKSIEMAKNGQPCVVEAKVVRWRGHSEGDNFAAYQDLEKMEKAMETCDCIKNLEDMMVEKGIASKEDFEKVYEEVQKELDDAFEFAFESPYATFDETVNTDLVYATDAGVELI